MPQEDCIFCKIVAQQIPANKVYEDEQCMAFHDIAPKAPVHVLLIPKLHVTSMAKLTEQHSALLGHMMVKVAEIAKILGVDDLPTGGFRLVSNAGDNARQEVQHLHFHIIGGTKLSSSL